MKEYNDLISDLLIGQKIFIPSRNISSTRNHPKRMADCLKHVIGIERRICKRLKMRKQLKESYTALARIWLLFSLTDQPGKHTFKFAIFHELEQLMQFLIRISDYPNALALFYRYFHANCSSELANCMQSRYPSRGLAVQGFLLLCIPIPSF